MTQRADAPSGIERVVVRAVGKTYGGTVALRGVDAVFERASVVSIEGPNGSGKSTLLGILGTSIVPSSGEIRYEPGAADRDELRSHIGWLSHQTLAYPDLTARENLRLAASLYGIDADAAWTSGSSRFGLAAYADHPLREASRGQRQRLALARALVHAPSLLLLDEPTTGLDADGVQRLLDAVRIEAERGAIVVLVTHDTGLADAVGATKLRLERGQVVSHG